MPRYRYDGPHPVTDDDGGLVRPGEIRDMDAEPGFGPWTELAADEPEPAAPAPPPPLAAPAAPRPAPPVSAPSSTAEGK